MGNQSFIRTPKGTHDILPGQSMLWQKIESTLENFAHNFGYYEIRTPAFEHTELFTRGVGSETDIVSKEMYTWVDQGGTSLTLKPELTAPVVRAFIQHNLAGKSSLTKLYYFDALFRRERPQKGRQRQFHQFGIEAFGSEYPEQDVEVISFAVRFLEKLGLSGLNLKINSLGSGPCRDHYRKALKQFLKPHFNSLTPTSQKRFETNPLRILDTKNPQEKELIEKAPSILDYLTADDKNHFNTVIEYLDQLKINYTIVPSMVRGLDYYTRTTFEISSDDIGAQDALCGGGRYDNLVETLGGKPTPAIGFAAGVERILLAFEKLDVDTPKPDLDVYFICMEPKALSLIIKLSDQLRARGKSSEMDLMKRSLKAQMRDANRLGAKIAVIIGSRELNTKIAQVKMLETGDQKEIELDRLLNFLE